MVALFYLNFLVHSMLICRSFIIRADCELPVEYFGKHASVSPVLIPLCPNHREVLEASLVMIAIPIHVLIICYHQRLVGTCGLTAGTIVAF